MTKEKATETKTNNKFAVIKLSGVQLKVSEGKKYDVNKLTGNKGDSFEVSEVLLTVEDENIKLGTPYVDGSKVVLEIASQTKGEKINGFKYKSKSRYRKHFGSRPLVTRVLVKEIL